MGWLEVEPRRSRWRDTKLIRAYKLPDPLRSLLTECTGTLFQLSCGTGIDFLSMEDVS